MKPFLLIISISFLTIIPAHSQVDTTSLPIKNKSNLFAFIGLGGGGAIMKNSLGEDEIKNGFARALSLTYQNKSNVFSFYTSALTKNESLSSDRVPTLTSSNIAMTYGRGLYGDGFLTAFVAGIGYTSSWMKFQNPDPRSPNIYETKEFKNAIAVLGIQASAHGKYLGIGMQGFYNFSSSFSNYFLLIGLEIKLPG